MKDLFVMVVYKWTKENNLGQAYCFKTYLDIKPNQLLVVGTPESPQFVRAVCMTTDPEQTKYVTKDLPGIVTWL